MSNNKTPVYAEAKLPKKKVNYRRADKQAPETSCATCWFHNHGHCKRVEGLIDGHFQCDAWGEK